MTPIRTSSLPIMSLWLPCPTSLLICKAVWWFYPQLELSHRWFSGQSIRIHDPLIGGPYSYRIFSLPIMQGKKRTSVLSLFYIYVTGHPKTRPDTRHKMRLVRILFTFENNTGHTDLRTDGRTDRRTDGRTDRRTDTTSYRDATAHLKILHTCMEMRVLSLSRRRAEVHKRTKNAKCRENRRNWGAYKAYWDLGSLKAKRICWKLPCPQRKNQQRSKLCRLL